MRALGRKLAEAAAFAIVMILIAWFDGSLSPEGAMPLWFQVLTRLLIYLLIFFAVSLLMDALFSRMEKK